MSATHTHGEMLPRSTLITAAALVLFALTATSIVRIAGIAPAASPAAMREQGHVAAIKSRDLRFIDRADGAVVIEDADKGGVASTIIPGQKTGFIRGVMRGLARERRSQGIGSGPAFNLTLWQDGELSLTDTATGRAIELTAFGTTNRASFAGLLDAKDTKIGGPDDMIARMMALGRTRFDTPCRVEVELSDEFCRANVVLANDYEVGPGDRVRVHGAPISVGFGEACVVERTATVERASAVERLWTKFAGHFEMTELYEVSFSDRTTV